MPDDCLKLLVPEVRRVISKLDWTGLRPVQVAAIKAFFARLTDLLIIAPTAGGKTEAWVLAALSQIVQEVLPSVQVLCISPLKALINDQFGRLHALAKELDIPVHRRHGDVGQHEREALRKHPGGILITTPESLEATLMNRPGEACKLFKHLQIITIDEVHALLDEERGIHLQSLLFRLTHLIGHRPRRIGLSATIGDVRVAQSFLNPDDPESVIVVRQDEDGRELKLGIIAYVENAES